MNRFDSTSFFEVSFDSIRLFFTFFFIHSIRFGNFQVLFGVDSIRPSRIESNWIIREFDSVSVSDRYTIDKQLSGYVEFIYKLFLIDSKKSTLKDSFHILTIYQMNLNIKQEKDVVLLCLQFDSKRDQMWWVSAIEIGDR